MSRARILYLDVPFENESGGDKNRSRFLFQSLRENFDVDLLLIGREGASAKPAWTHFKPLAMLTPLPAPFPRPSSTPSFTPADRDKFLSLLRENKYAAVFCRFTVGWELIELVRADAPETAVVVDVGGQPSFQAALVSVREMEAAAFRAEVVSSALAVPVHELHGTGRCARGSRSASCTRRVCAGAQYHATCR